MKIERTKNAGRNILFGFMLKILQIVLPFAMRTAILYCLGSEYLGLNSLFAQILQVLNLAELGVGSAMVFSMYKPIAEDDSQTICALMRLYKIYYRVIGTVVGVLGCIILPLLPYLIKDAEAVPVNIYLLFLMNLVQTICSYWLFGYKNCLLTAHQRTDITSKVTLVTNIFQYAVQLIVICFLRNYYLYVLVALVTIVLTNIGTAIVVNKIYPQYRAQGTLSKEVTKDLNRRVKDLFTARLGNVVINSADAIVISAFLGLDVLGIYQNYFYVITAVAGIVTVVFNACTAGIGNSLVTESAEKNFADFKKFTFIIAWIAGFCAACFLCLFQPFMQIWMKGDESKMLSFGVVICFAIYFYVYENDQMLNTYKDAAGIWHKDRFRPLVTAAVNLTMNIIMVVCGLGVYGIILSTVISLVVVGMPWLIHNLFSSLFSSSDRKGYVFRLLLYALVSAAVCAITYLVCSFVHLGKWATFFVDLAICLVVPNVLFLLVYGRTREMKETAALADRLTKGKLHKLLSPLEGDEKKEK